MRTIAGILLAFLCFATVAVQSHPVAADCDDVETQVELFQSLFVADRGPVRKWNQPIKVFITGEEEHVHEARALFDYYSREFGIDIRYVDENMDIYLAITNRLYATLLEHGEILFKGTYDDIGELYEFFKENAIKNRGYISKNRFRGPVAVASVLVVGTDYYDEDGAKAVLSSLILNTLFPGQRLKTAANAESVFFKAVGPEGIDECTLAVMKKYYDGRMEAGMSWEQARKVIAGERI
jgi:hypothetical protein